jgi:hypothetical protein
MRMLTRPSSIVINTFMLAGLTHQIDADIAARVSVEMLGVFHSQTG